MLRKAKYIRSLTLVVDMQIRSFIFVLYDPAKNKNKTTMLIYTIQKSEK